MPSSLFPQRRADGTFSVAIRYRVSGGASGGVSGDSASNAGGAAGAPGAVTDAGGAGAVTDAIRGALGNWLTRKASVDHVDMRKEFTILPHVEVDESGDALVVFDGQSTSILWKGLMVEAARDMESIDGATYAGFWDLVSGQPHPASVRGE